MSITQTCGGDFGKELLRRGIDLRNGFTIARTAQFAIDQQSCGKSGHNKLNETFAKGASGCEWDRRYDGCRLTHHEPEPSKAIVRGQKKSMETFVSMLSLKVVAAALKNRVMSAPVPAKRTLTQL